MTKLKIIISDKKITFSKGKGSFSLHKETTEADLKRYFELANITEIISHFNKTEVGWVFFNKEEKRAYCTHKDLIEKLEELENK